MNKLMVTKSISKKKYLRLSTNTSKNYLTIIFQIRLLKVF